MILDDAIKHLEEVAKEQEELYRLCPVSDMQFCDGTKDCKTLENGKNKGCLKCVEEIPTTYGMAQRLQTVIRATNL